MTSLGEVATLQKGMTITAKSARAGLVPVIAGGKKPAYFHAEANRPSKTITVSSSGAYAGYVAFHGEPIWASDCVTAVPKDTQICTPEFLYYFMLSKQNEIYGLQRGSGMPHVYAKDLALLEIGVPPLDEQSRIVETLDGHLSRLDKALAEIHAGRKKEKSFKHSLLHSLFESLDAEVYELGEVSKPRYGKDVPKHLRGEGFTYPVVGSAGVMTFTEVPLVAEPSILVGRKGNVGAVQMFDTPCSPVDTAYYLTCPDDVDLEFMYFQLESMDLKSLDSSTTIPSLRRQDLESVSFRKPDLATQKTIALEIKTKLASIDSALNQLESISSSLLLLRRSLLNAAFSGTLLKGI